MLNLDSNQITVFAVFLFLFLISWVVFIFILSARKKLIAKEIEKMNIKIVLQEEMVSKIILTQEEERKRIARDLHDEIGSKLIAIHLNLYSLKSLKKSTEEKNEILNQLLEINTNMTEQSRIIAHNLLPPVLEKFGIEAALQEIESEYNKSNIVKISSFCNADINDIEKNKQLHIFRIVKELISNSVKHGKASEISVSIFKENSQILFRYEDDGIGFNQNNKDKITGIGIINIQNRLKILKASHQTESNPGKGFHFYFSFDL